MSQLIINLILCTSILLNIPKGAIAQDKQDKSLSDSAKVHLARKLSISTQKAAAVQAAYGYRHEDIIKLMKDHKLPPAERQTRLKVLLNQRQHQIDSLLTPQQKTLLNTEQSEVISKANAHRRQMEQRHEQELNKVPHKRLLRSSRPTDSLSTKEKIKKQ